MPSSTLKLQGSNRFCLRHGVEQAKSFFYQDFKALVSHVQHGTMVSRKMPKKFACYAAHQDLIVIKVRDCGKGEYEHCYAETGIGGSRPVIEKANS